MQAAAVKHAQLKRRAFWGNAKVVNSLLKGALTRDLREQLEKLLSLEPTRRVISDIATEIIPSPYTPSILIGQRGLKALSNIKSDTLLGEYEGQYTIDGKVISVEKEGEDEDADWGFVSNDYSFEGFSVYGGKQKCFSINGMKYGNGLLEYANDPKGSSQLANAEWLTVQYGPEPFVFIKTLRPIGKNEWITVDYGHNFWDSRSTL